MTELRVLPVLYGDACLLRCKRGQFLFDGGIDYGGLLQLLRERSVKGLRAVVCTNLSRERVGGVLELMDSGFPVKEFWLPFDSVALIEKARAFNGDWTGWSEIGAERGLSDAPAEKLWVEAMGTQAVCSQNCLSRQATLEGIAVLFALGMTLCFGKELFCHKPQSFFRQHTSDGVGTSFFFDSLEILLRYSAKRWKSLQFPITQVFDELGTHLFRGGQIEDVAALCGKLLFLEAEQLPGGSQRGAQALVSTLALTILMGAIALKANASLKFMRCAAQMTNTLLPRMPIRCLNGEIVQTTQPSDKLLSPQSLLKELRRMGGQRNGLIYQYGEADCGILFCSDSQLPFLATNEFIELKSPTVVMAPYQGGVAKERAYMHIVSSAPENDYWLRAQYSGVRHVSTLFKKQMNTMCLHNCSHAATQEIVLRYTQAGWNPLAGGICACV